MAKRNEKRRRADELAALASPKGELEDYRDRLKAAPGGGKGGSYKRFGESEGGALYGEKPRSNRRSGDALVDLAGKAAGRTGGVQVINQGQREQNMVKGSGREGDLYRTVRRADGRIGHMYDEGKNPHTVWLPMDKDRVQPRTGNAKKALERQARPAPTSNNFRDALNDSPARSESLIELLKTLRVPRSRTF